MQIQLFDNSSLELLNESNISEIENEISFLSTCMKSGLSKYVINSGDSEMNLLLLNKKVIPLVVNKNTNNCYILSPIAHYIKYSQKEIFLLENSIYKYFLISLLQIGKILFRILNFNKVVYVNNWLFSTNPPLDLNEDELEAMKDLLQKKIQNRVIIIRSVDSQKKENLELLKKCGFELVINREVHFWKPEELQTIHNKKRKNVRQDIAFAERKDFQIEIMTNPSKDNFFRISNIYQMLYISKYTDLNPIFTADFMEEIFNWKILEFLLIKKDKDIVGFASYFENDSTIYPLIIGYDTENDKINNWNLYRMIFGILFKKSIENNKRLFLSSGASSFKKNRGSQTQYEYEAVYFQHLPSYRKTPWRLIKKGMELNAEKVYASNAF